jgi:hypothetical protein
MDHMLEQFCDQFAQGASATGSWVLEASRFATGSLLRSSIQCPLSAQARLVTAGHYTAGSAREDLAQANGLTLDQAGAIENASDDVPGHDPVLRARLLAACGLTGHPHEG